MTSDDQHQRPGWVGPLLLVVGVLVLAAGLGTIYMGGLCGFQADPAEAAACFRRWRISGALVALAGAAIAVWGLRRTRAARRR